MDGGASGVVTPQVVALRMRLRTCDGPAGDNAQNARAHHLTEVAKLAATPKVWRLRALPCMTMKVLLREPTRTPKAGSKVTHQVT